nr:NAD(P)H-binding protein [Micromonospora sp. DSM 115978]
MTILVTGATGNVGRQVVTQLLSAGESVRAATRDPGRARLPADGSDAAHPSPIEIVRVDLAEPATLEANLAGVDSVFLVWPFLTADAAPAVVDVLRRHVRHVVYLSSAGVRDDDEVQSDPITQFHADVERLLVASGLGWTFLRPSGFATNNLGWAEEIRSAGVVREAFGGMRRSMIH